MHSPSPSRRRGAAAFLAAGALLLLSTGSVFAAGTADLYPNGAADWRANTEWRTNSYGAGVVMRRTLLEVDLQQNEYLLMGSSAVGQGSGDVLVWDPGLITGPTGDEDVTASPSYSCAAQRAVSGDTAQGEITSRAEELAGPDTVPTGGVANGYDPCYYQAPVSGIYSVAILGPAGFSANADGGVAGDVALSAPGDFDTSQGSSVAAWDLTVRDDLTNPASTQTGRVFTYVLAAFTGDNGRPVDLTTYTVTKDGYRYAVQDRGMDPDGWVQYANQVGFLDPDGAPLYHDAVALDSGSPGQLTSIQGGVQFATPEYPIFFEPPADATLQALGYPLTAESPNIANVSFTGSDQGSTSYYSTGGSFTFDSNIAGVYQIVISRDGSNFDPTNPLNAVLRGVATVGTQQATWDGKDNSGNYFPAGGPYVFQAIMHGGEYHFPFIDVENDVNGGPTVTLLNPPNGVCPSLTGGCSGGFYDDTGYTTSTGTVVGTPGQVLCGTDPPSPAMSDPVNGFDTSSTQRAFGATSGGNTNVPCTGDFGDAKGLDLWTYYPSTADVGGLTIIPTADLAVSDSASDATPNVGTPVTFTVTVSDLGPQDATGVDISDLLPAGLTYVSSSPSQGTYDPSTGLWQVGTVPDTGSATLTITVIVNNAGAITDTATETAEDQTDPNSANNSASAVVNGQAADIAVSNGVDNATPQVGSPVTFTVSAANLGPDDATGVTVDDSLPAGITFTGAAPSVGTYDPTTGTWDIGSLPYNTAVTLSLTGTVTQAGVQTDTATRTASSPIDTNPANDTASAQVDGQAADIGVTDTVDNPTPDVNSDVTFTVTATNHGPDDATGVQITDLLPNGLSYVSSNASAGSYDSSTGLWAIGPLAETASAQLTITAQVMQPGLMTDTATRTASSPVDTNAANDTASTSVNGQAADIGVTDSVDQPTANLGSTVHFTITATDNGPDDANGVQITDALPAGLTFVSSNPSQGTYDSSTGVWDAGYIGNGNSATLTLTVTVAQAAVLTDTATRTASAPVDTNPSNDSASAQVTGEAADIAVTDTVNDDTPDLGSTVTFTVTATNDGPDDATGVQIHYLMPSALTYVGSSTAVGSFDPSTGMWTIGPLGNSDTATLQVTATVTKTGYLTTMAFREASQPIDPNPSNDEGAATINGTAADMHVELTAPQSLQTGGAGVYIIAVGNNGPDLAAAPITMVDTLPVGVTYDGYSGTGWQCAAVGQLVTCTSTTAVSSGSLAPQLLIDFTATSAGGTTLIDEATVSSTTYDPVLTNNTAVADTTVSDPPIPPTPTTGAAGLGVIGGGLLAGGLLSSVLAWRRRRQP